ncbi:MAG: hypothetical protein H6561_08910 [Lewinellaceae bacterium]|nr:hypothetical protein [Lewinellaceae bacterium]
MMGIAAGLIWLAGIGWLGYFSEQTHFYGILAGYAVAFGAFGWLLGLPRESLSIRFTILLAIFGRLLLVGSVPLLSNDIYRFLWDGLRWLDGANAYVGTPTQVITIFARDPSYANLYPLLNSPDYYSVYPPLLQILFIPAAILWRSTGSLIAAALVLRIFLLFGDLATWVGMKQLKIPIHRRWWYFLNPLVVVEVFGNLHAEGIMVGFLALGLGWLAQRKDVLVSGWAFAASLSTKLVTAIFGPILLLTVKPLKRMTWLMVAAGCTLILAIPLISALWKGGFLDSLDLYFRKFEFNAGLYYLARSIGQAFTGFNPIAYIGPGLALIGALCILIIAFWPRKRTVAHLQEGLVWTMMAYLLTTTTLHPWYLVTLVFTGVLAGRRFPLAWSFLAVFSYSHYLHGDFHERFIWIGAEYALLLAAVISDYWTPESTRMEKVA